MDWKALGVFILQHLSVGAVAYGTAVTAGQTPKAAAITAAIAAISGAANHVREQAPVAAPMPKTDAPPLSPVKE